MDIKVLGTFSVKVDGMPVLPAARLTRQTLALLAAYPGQLVPTAVLAEEVAPQEPPGTGRLVVQTAVRELRERFAEALRGGRRGEDLLSELPGGYRLETGAGTLDTWDFDRYAGAGYRAMEAGDAESAARRLRQALALWSGEAFSGVEAGPRLQLRIDDLERSRRRAVDQWIEAELRAGRDRQLITELVAVIARLRLREPLYERLLEKLHPGNTSQTALTAYWQLRREHPAPTVAGA